MLYRFIDSILVDCGSTSKTGQILGLIWFICQNRTNAQSTIEYFKGQIAAMLRQMSMKKHSVNWHLTWDFYSWHGFWTFSAHTLQG